MSLVEDETRRYKPTKNYLEQLGQPLYHSFEVRDFVIEKEMIDRLILDGYYEGRIRTTFQSITDGNVEYETVRDTISEKFHCNAVFLSVMNYLHLLLVNKRILLRGMNVSKIPMLNWNINKYGKEMSMSERNQRRSQ